MKRTKFYTLIFFSLLIFQLKSSAQQSLQWANSFGSVSQSDDNEMISQIATDKSGNIYVAGALGGNAVVDSLVLSTAGVKNSGFVAKFTCSGHLLWLHQYGNHVPHHDRVNGMVLDKDNNVYIVGQMEGPTNKIDNTSVSPLGNGCYVSKLDSNGVILWTKYSSGSNIFLKTGVPVTLVNNLPVVCTNSTASGANIFGSAAVVAPGLELFGMDASGNVTWIHNIVPMSNAQLNFGYTKMVSDENGNIFMVGDIVDSMTVNGHHLQMLSGGSESLLMKFDSNGGFQWLKYDNVTDYIHGGNVFDIAALNDRIYLSGGVSDSFSIFGYQPVFYSNGHPAGTDFAMCLSADSGNLVWGKCRDSVNIFVVQSALPGIMAGLDGNAYFACGITHEHFSMGTININGSGASDPFVIKISPAGVPLSFMSLNGQFTGGSYNYFTGGSTVAQDGSLLLNTFLATTINVLSNAHGNSGGNNDMMIVKFGIPCDSASLQPPYAPLDVLATCEGNPSGVLVTWFDNSGTETGYHVYRSPNGTSSWTLVGTTAANVTMYLDNTTVLNNNYWYRVNAFNVHGDGPASAMDSARYSCSTGIEEASAGAGSMLLYPNPVNEDGTVQLVVNDTYLNKNCELRIYDALGKEVIYQSLGTRPGNFNYMLNVRDLPSGIYIVELRSEDAKMVSKLIKP